MITHYQCLWTGASESQKEFYQIRKTTSTEDFQLQQQRRFLAQERRRYNNEIIKILNFQITSNKMLVKKSPTVLATTITVRKF